LHGLVVETCYGLGTKGCTGDLDYKIFLVEPMRGFVGMGGALYFNPKSIHDCRRAIHGNVGLANFFHRDVTFNNALVDYCFDAVNRSYNPGIFDNPRYERIACTPAEEVSCLDIIKFGRRIQFRSYDLNVNNAYVLHAVAMPKTRFKDANVMDPFRTLGARVSYSIFGVKVVDLKVEAKLLLEGDFQRNGYACGPFSLGLDLSYCGYGMSEPSVAYAAKALGVRFLGYHVDDCFVHDGSRKYCTGERVLLYLRQLDAGAEEVCHVISGTVRNQFKVEDKRIGHYTRVDFQSTQDFVVDIINLPKIAGVGIRDVANANYNDENVLREQQFDVEGIYTFPRSGPTYFVIDGLEKVDNYVAPPNMNNGTPNIDPVDANWTIPRFIESTDIKVWRPIIQSDLVCTECDRAIQPDGLFAHFTPVDLVAMNNLIQTKLDQDSIVGVGIGPQNYADVLDRVHIANHTLYHDLMGYDLCGSYCKSCMMELHYGTSRAAAVNYNNLDDCCQAMEGNEMVDRGIMQMANPLGGGEDVYYRHCRVVDYTGDRLAEMQPLPILGYSNLHNMDEMQGYQYEEFHRAPGNFERIGGTNLRDGYVLCHQLERSVPTQNRNRLREMQDATDRLKWFHSREGGLGGPLHLSGEYYRCDSCQTCGVPRSVVVVGPSWAYDQRQIYLTLDAASRNPLYALFDRTRWLPAAFPFRIGEMNATLRRAIRNGTIGGTFRKVVWCSPVPPPLMTLCGQGRIVYVWRYCDTIIGPHGDVVRQPDSFKAMWSRYRHTCRCLGRCSCGRLCIRFLSADFRRTSDMLSWEVIEYPNAAELQMLAVREGEQPFISSHHYVRNVRTTRGNELKSFFVPIAPSHYVFGSTISGAYNVISPPIWMQSRSVVFTAIVNGVQYEEEAYHMNRLSRLQRIMPDMTRRIESRVVRRIWRSFDPKANGPSLREMNPGIYGIDAEIINIHANWVPPPPGVLGVHRPPPDWRFKFVFSVNGGPTREILVQVEKLYQIITTVAGLVSSETTHDHLRFVARNLVATNVQADEGFTLSVRDYLAEVVLSVVLYEKCSGAYSAPVTYDEVSFQLEKTGFFSRSAVLRVGGTILKKDLYVPKIQWYRLLFGMRHSMQSERAWFRHGEDVAAMAENMDLRMVWNLSGARSHAFSRWLFRPDRFIHLPWWMGWINITSDLTDLYLRQQRQYCNYDRNVDLIRLMSVFGAKIDTYLVKDSHVELVTVGSAVAWGRKQSWGAGTVEWVSGRNATDMARCVPCGKYAPIKYHWMRGVCAECSAYRRMAQKHVTKAELRDKSNTVQKGSLLDAVCFPPGNFVEVGGPLMLPGVECNPKKKPLRGEFYHNGPPEEDKVTGSEVCDPADHANHPMAINSPAKWSFKPRKVKTNILEHPGKYSELLGVGFPKALPATYVDSENNQACGFKYRIFGRPKNTPNQFALSAAQKLIRRLCLNKTLFPKVNMDQPVERLSFVSSEFLYSDGARHLPHYCTGPFCHYRHTINQELFRVGDDLCLYNAGLIFGNIQHRGWLDDMLPRRRSALAGGAIELMERGVGAFKSRRYGSFIKRELAATRAPEYVCGVLEGNPRIIQGPPEASHVAAGPTLRVFTHELHDNWNFGNFLTYVGGATPVAMAKYASDNMHPDGSNKFPNVVYLMNDYSMFDCTYSHALFMDVVYPIYSFFGMMETAAGRWGRPYCRLHKLLTSALRYWEMPKGRFSRGIKYRACSMNSSGRDDTAAMNALVNGICILFSVLSLYYRVPMTAIDTLTDDQVNYVTSRCHIAVLGDDSLVRLSEELLSGRTMEEYKADVSRAVGAWGIEAKPVMEREFRKVVFLGSRPYPCRKEGRDEVWWGPTIGRRLYKMTTSCDLQERPLEWLYSVVDATMRTCPHVPIIRETCNAITKLLKERKVALHEYKAENFATAAEALRKGSPFGVIVDFGAKASIEPNQYTYQMVRDIYNIDKSAIEWYGRLLQKVQRLPVLVRDPIIDQVFTVDEL